MNSVSGADIAQANAWDAVMEMQALRERVTALEARVAAIEAAVSAPEPARQSVGEEDKADG